MPPAAENPSQGYSPELIAEVRLAMTSGVGPRLRANLIAALGSVGKVFSASSDTLQRIEGIGPTLAGRLIAARSSVDAEGELRQALRSGINPLVLGDPRYPDGLKSIHDPPGVLFVRGEPLQQDRMAVALVGSRHATRYGIRIAQQLAGGLARAGVTVVSGLARGIDGAAHQAALDAGGRTIAVLGGGLMRIYPPEHAGLADRVAEQGWLASEAPPTRPPLAGAFPQRNRVISGLSLAVVVVEAAERSGALITCTHAAEQGRDVMAVPGPVDSPAAAGCNRLIQDGAKLVMGVEDILSELESAPRVGRTGFCETDTFPVEQSPKTADLELSDVERAVWNVIGAEQTSIDQVVAGSGLPTHRVLATLSGLEMRGLLRRPSGAFVSRAD